MPRKATLYRMILPDHTCPYGVRAKELLEEQGFEVDDRILHSREEVDAFEAQHGVQATPQVFIDDERIGGSDDLARYLQQQNAVRASVVGKDHPVERGFAGHVFVSAC